MAFPEFETTGTRILFFSRGRGRGHAVLDIAVAQALAQRRPDMELRFVSYGTGGDTLASAGMPFVDLGLTDAGGVVDTTVLAGKLIAWLDPDVVISHEEFPVLPIARVFDKPTILLTDWFLDSEAYAMNTLKYADRILFLGPRGVFPEPVVVADRIEYLGPVLRPFTYGPGDRNRARLDLGIDAAATVVSVFPGSWREAETPLLARVLEAFNGMNGPRHLIWLAGEDYELVRAAVGDLGNTTILRECADIDRLMVATDIAITKSNRKAVYELQHLGIRTIAVSFRKNPGDDIAVAALPNVLQVQPQELTAQRLIDLLATPATATSLQFCSAEECAERISELVPPSAQHPSESFRVDE